MSSPPLPLPEEGDEVASLQQRLAGSVDADVFGESLKRQQELQDRLEASEEENARVLGLLLELRQEHGLTGARLQTLMDASPPIHTTATTTTTKDNTNDTDNMDKALQAALNEISLCTESASEEAALSADMLHTERQQHTLDTHLREGGFRKELLHAEQRVLDETRRAEACEAQVRRIKGVMMQDEEKNKHTQARLAAVYSKKLEKKRDRVAALEIELLKLEGQLLSAQSPSADTELRASAAETQLREYQEEMRGVSATVEAHDDLQDLVGELRAECEGLKAELLSKNDQRLTEQLAASLEEKETETNRADRLQIVCTQLKQDLKQADDDAARTADKYEEAMRQVETVTQSMVAQSESKLQLLSDTTRLREQLATVTEDNEVLSEQASSAKASIANLTAQLDAANVASQGAKVLQEQVGALEREVREVKEEARKEREGHEAELAERGVAVGVLEAEVAALGVTMAHLNEELEKARAFPAEVVPDEVLKTELEVARREGNDLRQQLLLARDSIDRTPLSTTGPELVNVRGTPTTGPAAPPTSVDSSLRANLEEVRRQLSRSQEDCLALKRRLHRETSDPATQDPQVTILQHRIIALEENLRNRNDSHDQLQRELSRVRGRAVDPGDVELKLRQELANCRKDMAKLGNTHRELLSELELSQKAKRVAERKMSEALEKLGRAPPVSPARVSHIDPVVSLQDALKSRGGRRGDEKKVQTLANHLAQIAGRGHMTEGEVDEAMLLMLERRDVPTRQRPPLQHLPAQQAPLRPPSRATSPGLSHMPRGASPGVSHGHSHHAVSPMKTQRERAHSPTSLPAPPRSPLFRSYPSHTFAAATTLTTSNLARHSHAGGTAGSAPLSNASPSLSASAAPGVQANRRMSPGRPGRSPERRVWR